MNKEKILKAALDAGFIKSQIGEVVVPAPHCDAFPYLQAFVAHLAAAAPSPAVAVEPVDSNGAAPPLPLGMDTAEKISLSTVDCPELLEKLGAYAAAPNLDTAWAVLQCADRRLHHIISRRFEIARGEPIAHLRFRAAQQWSGIGGHDIEHAEWFETCHAHEVGDDKQPAFPVYAATPSPSLAVRDGVDWKERAERAESRLAEIQRGVEVLRSIIEDGYLSDTNTARGHEVLAILNPQPQPTGCTHNCNQGRNCTCGPQLERNP